MEWNKVLLKFLYTVARAASQSSYHENSLVWIYPSMVCENKQNSASRSRGELPSSTVQASPTDSPQTWNSICTNAQALCSTILILEVLVLEWVGGVSGQGPNISLWSFHSSQTIAASWKTNEIGFSVDLLWHKVSKKKGLALLLKQRFSLLNEELSSIYS